MDEQLEKGAHISGAPREQLGARLRAEYENGARIRWLAEDIGRSYGFVHRLLTEAGTTFRRQGGDHLAARAAQRPPKPARDNPLHYQRRLQRDLKAAPRFPLDPTIVAELRRQAGVEP